MRNIIRIARVELSALFFSPIAWFLLILFLIQASMGYIEKVEYFVRLRGLGSNTDNMTFNFFSSPLTNGLFLSVMGNLYLYIPLITMGLISRETNSGTIKLLYSSPVKLSSIVAGKFVAMLFFNLCMIVMLGILIVFAAFQIESMDYGLIFSGLMAIYLLLGAYAAIGLFMSCLSTYQVVAALATFALFALLKFVGTLWQEYDLLRDLTGYLSISGRTENMIMGLVTSRDVLYYLLITAMFLAFAYFKLKSVRASENGFISFLKYTGVMAVVLAIGYFTSIPQFIGYWDVTRTNSNTISPRSQEVLKQLGDAPVEVTTYINLLDNTYYRGAPEARNSDKRRWERYIRFKPQLHLNYVYYYDSSFDESFSKNNAGFTLEEIAKKRAKSYNTNKDRFKTPDEIRKEINLFPEKNRLVMLVKYKGRETFLRTFNDMIFWPLETETIAALSRLSGPLPRIAFLQGEEERSIDKLGDRHYKLATSELNVRAALINQGFDVENLKLKGGESIPEGITALVIADPRTHFEPDVLKKIEKYIDEGGNLLLSGEPGKQSVLNPILSKLGVQIMEGTILQEDPKLGPQEVRSFVTPLGLEFGKKTSYLHNNKLGVSTREVAGLSYRNDGDFTIRELMNTNGEFTWNKTGKLVLDSADIVFNEQEGDVKRSFPTALALTRMVNQKEQRILVTSDADFLSNIELGRNYPRTGNAFFYQGFLGWFSYGKYPVEPTWPDPIDNTIKIDEDNIPLLKWVIYLIIPASFLISGTVLLIRRKRK